MGRFAKILSQKEAKEQRLIQESIFVLPTHQQQKQGKQNIADQEPEMQTPWDKLLAAANALYRGQNVAGALRSVWRLGAECVVQPNGSYKLIPGQLNVQEWEQVKRELLVPYVPQLKQVYHFAKHGWVYLHSSVLDETIVITLDKEALDLPAGYEVYSIEDMKVLERATPEEIRQVHKVRKVFGGGNVLNG